ncbi:hypothetical protein [Bradyrhizobium sp. SSUT77]|uniref:hypothetical protein n=1 Tax=Bradyrhizobium sp. SSUT77 TaxID=3040603 RepID=UPI00244D5A40|nr:hypothetical protein [Bradyrhizobium sp. SSUT77]MDH2341511.1 hypothetical protein [Bradyrhizobium sp. SSUT77]
MTTADRNERIKVLAKVALAILRRNAAGFIVETPDGRARVYDLRHNEMTLSLRRKLDDPVHTGKLEIRFDGDRVLFAEWNDDGFAKRSYRSGDWEARLRRYDRIPALAGR